MTYANPDERKGVIAGLRGLANFLEENPDVPSPRLVEVMVFPSAVADEDALREVDAIAVLISARIDDRTANYGNYTASRYFGPVQYRAVAIPAASRTYHEERASYVKNVIVPGKGECH